VRFAKVKMGRSVTIKMIAANMPAAAALWSFQNLQLLAALRGLDMTVKALVPHLHVYTE
jgi:hypothetical protein